ncbi:MAG TPA: hypothetical protein VEH54_07330 [Steroidobacteraceae bacterium]|nr:hypothetical protein [Steroidobacteraceae bacterium]
MASDAAVSSSQVLRDVQNFSLVLGGPTYQLLRRTHLADDALALLVRRVVVISLIAWLPLFLLSALEGHLLGKSVVLPFLPDVETHIRFLVVVPLLLLSELVVHARLLPVARAFLDRNLIPESAMPRFDAAINSAFRLRNSVAAELLLLVLVYTVGVLIVWRRHLALQVTSWYLPVAAADPELSGAGLWYVAVSLPIFQFLLLRWYFRIFIWARFLWQVSKIKLTLVPTHPDRVGGLGLLSNTVYAFAVLLLAHGAMVAAQIADRVLVLGATLPEFTTEIVVVVIFLLCVVFGPLMVFAPQLSRTKRAALLEYGTFAERYTRDFDVKWLRGGAPANEPLLGSSDIQSLADLANSFAVVRSMQLAPISKEALLQLAVPVVLPIAPLLLTIMPLEALLKKLAGVLF